MYAKLFARITESSLMEEEIPVRYTFVMLLAISDPTGLVIGTDVAISRRLNMPIKQFRKCLTVLSSPDKDSNSNELDGRRVVESEGERGYQIVNYEKYRGLQDEDARRTYMRNYMRNRRSENLPVNEKSLPTFTKPNPASAYASSGDSSVQEDRGTGKGGNSSFPATAKEAEAHAAFIGCSPEFAIQVWNKAMGRGGCDARDVPVRSFRHHLQTEWTYQQERLAKNKPAGETHNTVDKRQVKEHIVGKLL